MLFYRGLKFDKVFISEKFSRTTIHAVIRESLFMARDDGLFATNELKKDHFITIAITIETETIIKLHRNNRVSFTEKFSFRSFTLSHFHP